MSVNDYKIMDSSARNANEVLSSSILDMELTEITQKRRFSHAKIAMGILAAVAVSLLISTIVLAILIGIKYNQKPTGSLSERFKRAAITDKLKWPEPSGSLYGRYKRAAIATDNGVCSIIGRQIMIQGGNAVDATIASLICVGAVNPQSSGIGGGFIMTIYNSSTKSCSAIVAREKAPAASSKEMFLGNPQASSIGYQAIAIPGEIAGYWTAYQRFGSGRLPWSELLQPTIALCLKGFPVSPHLAKTLHDQRDGVLNDTSMRSTFVDPATGQVYQEGDVITRKELGMTLQRLANASNPAHLFYRGDIAQTIVNEMRQNGGPITLADLSSYTVEVHKTALENSHLPHNLAMCGPPPPASFAVTQSIIAVMGAFYGDAAKKESLSDDPLMYHRLIETMKFAYAQRILMGDGAFVKSAVSLAKNMTTPEFTKWIKSQITGQAEDKSHYKGMLVDIPEDHGTSHTSTLDEEGNAVACTSTINNKLGSMRLSPKLGFIWNDQMDDFSTPGENNGYGYPPSPTNYIVPGKRPMSSMSPMVVYDKTTGKVKLVIGAAGGSRIISSVAQATIRALWFNQTIKQAIDWPRLHNQFLPHHTEYEASFPPELIKEMRDRDQNMTKVDKMEGFVQAIIVDDDGSLYGNCDFRREIGTFPAGF